MILGVAIMAHGYPCPTQRDWETTTGNGHFKLDHGAAADVIAETKQAATEMAANARAVHLTLGYDADPMQSEAGGAFQDFGKDALAGKASARTWYFVVG